MSGDMKGMADLLRSGATMMSKSCPECGSPLFQLKSGEVVCATCQRRVVIVPEGEESTVEAGVRLESVEKVIVEKLVTLSQVMSQESNPDALKSLSELMNSLLGNLDKLRASHKT